MVESKVAARPKFARTCWHELGARFLIIPPLTLASSFDFILVAVLLTLIGTIIFHQMAKNGWERWRSPTVPMIFCLLLVTASILVAMSLSLVR